MLSGNFDRKLGLQSSILVALTLGNKSHAILPFIIRIRAIETHVKLDIMLLNFWVTDTCVVTLLIIRIYL